MANNPKTGGRSQLVAYVMNEYYEEIKTLAETHKPKLSISAWVDNHFKEYLEERKREVEVVD